MKEITSPYLDIFDEPIVDNSIEEFEYDEIKENINDIDKDGLRTLETRAVDVYYLPHKAFLEVRGKLVKADGTNYAANDSVTLVNNGWSSFQSATYKIEGQTVEDISLFLPQASTIMNLVTFSDDYSRSTATNMLWYKDTNTGAAIASEFASATTLLPAATVANGDQITGANFRGIDFANSFRQAGYNQGFAARRLITITGNQICLFLPLSTIFGFCRDIDTVFLGVKHTVLLNRSIPNNHVFHGAGVDDGKFVITGLSLWMPKVKPSIKYLQTIEEGLISGNKKHLYFEQMRVYREQFNATQRVNQTWRITTNQGSELPRHIFIAFQSTAQDENQISNNMIFNNAGLQRIQVKVNNGRYPEQELECDFNPATRNYSRAYAMFLEAANKYQNTNTGTQISAEEFATLYPVFHFDVSKHSERLMTGSVDIQATWTLQANFPGGVPYNAYAVILSDRYLTLNPINGKTNIIV